MLKKSFGFTLIEVLVAISILGIAALVAIPNYHRFNETQKLSNAASSLASAFKAAETNAQSSINCNTGTPNNFVPNEWTIKLDSSGPTGTYIYGCDYTDNTGTVDPGTSTTTDIKFPITIEFCPTTDPDCSSTPCVVSSATVAFSNNNTSFTSTCLGSIAKMKVKVTDSSISTTSCIDIEKGGVISLVSC